MEASARHGLGRVLLGSVARADRQAVPRPPSARLVQLAALAAGALACASSSGPTLPRARPEPAARLTEPQALCVGRNPAEPCLRADAVEGWLQDPELEILGIDDTPAGIQETKVLTLRVATDAGPAVFRAKWRTQGRDSTRRELAAYVIQKMFLEPHQYVVPPTSGHCFPIDHYRERVDPTAESSFPGVECAYGILQYWLENVQTMPEAQEAGWFEWDEGGVYDEDLWEESELYRDALAHVNLLAYLIDHADTHWAQFLIAEDAERPMVYSIDNSLSFGVEQNSDLRSHDWSQLKVPALPRAAIERLRALDAPFERLQVLEQHVRRGRDLHFEPASPPAPPPDRAFAWVDGRVKIRLVEGEVQGFGERLTRLLERIDRGELALY